MKRQKERGKRHRGRLFVAARQGGRARDQKRRRMLVLPCFSCARYGPIELYSSGRRQVWKGCVGRVWERGTRVGCWNPSKTTTAAAGKLWPGTTTHEKRPMEHLIWLPRYEW